MVRHLIVCHWPVIIDISMIRPTFKYLNTCIISGVAIISYQSIQDPLVHPHLEVYPSDEVVDVLLDHPEDTLLALDKEQVREEKCPCVRCNK